MPKEEERNFILFMMIVPTRFQDPLKVEASGLNSGSKNNYTRVQNTLFVKEMRKHYFPTLENSLDPHQAIKHIVGETRLIFEGGLVG